MAAVKGSRNYSSQVRDEQARRTRMRIVHAADELFRERGYAKTTMKDIAEAAGVARDTVHAVFGTKAALMPAIIDLRLVPDESVLNVSDSPDGQRVMSEADPARQIELFADFITKLNAALRPVFEMLRGAASTEPEVARLLVTVEESRMRNMQRYARWFAARGPLRMSTKRAGETIFAIVSPEVGRLLCDELGWTQKQHAGWVADTLKRTLLPD